MKKEGGLTFSNVIRVYDAFSLKKNPLKSIAPVLSRTFEDMEFNNPLCYLTLPGFALGTGGIYMGLNFLQAFYLEEPLNLESTLFTALLTVVGVLMAFMGVLLHLIAGLLRYKLNPRRISNS